MSLFSRIFGAVIGFFAGIWHKAQPLVEEYMTKAIEVGTLIRDALMSDDAILITQIIPGTWDDILRQKIIDILQKVLPELTIYNECAALTDPEQVIECILKNLKFSSDRARDLFIHDLVALITADLSDGKFTMQEILAVLELKYQFDKEHEDKDEK